MTSLTKKSAPPTLKFFSSAIYQTGRSVRALEQLSSAIGRGARAFIRQPKTAVFQAKIEVRIYLTPALKVLTTLSSTCPSFLLIGFLHQHNLLAECLTNISTQAWEKLQAHYHSSRISTTIQLNTGPSPAGRASGAWPPHFTFGTPIAAYIQYCI